MPLSSHQHVIIFRQQREGFGFDDKLMSFRRRRTLLDYIKLKVVFISVSHNQM